MRRTGNGRRARGSAVRGRAAAKMTAATMTAMVALWSGGANAVPFELGDGWEVNWDTTISVGTSWRTANRDSKLYKAADGARIGLTDGTAGSSSDGGNLNYDKGDTISRIFKVISDVEVKKDSFGALVRVKAWYDQALNHGDVAYGNQANGYTANTSLSDSGFEKLQRFDGVELLDAYVYDTFDMEGMPLQIRLGRQVINWGESLFFQGVNQINPLDVPALRRPGSELKEGLLPVWAVNANIGLGGGVSLEGFYQLAWEPTTVDGCGTYWSTVDINVGSSPGFCNKVVLGSLSSANAITAGSYLPLVKGRDARNGGQGGVALRMPVDAIDTEFGLYAMNVHSRTPIVSGRLGDWGLTPAALRSTVSPIIAHQKALARLGVKSAEAFWEYPEDMQVYGLSATTNLAGWSVGSEFSFTPNLPVQRNANDLLNALITGTGPMGSYATGGAALSEVSGYDRLHRWQAQLNGVKTFGGVLGSDNSTVLGEAAFQWNDAPNYKSGTAIRYGRSFIFGTGSSAGYNTCTNGANTSSQGCQNDGYVTRFAWGYRLRGQLTYSDIFGTGVVFKPSLSLAHDVTGVSADGQMNEGRIQLGVGSRFTYDQVYNLDFNYVTYAKNAKFDPYRDHDFASVSFSMTF